jgi:hypothetical protein
MITMLERVRPAAPSTAVVIAGDEETRVLFRGLLRLHRFKILGEADGARRGLELVAQHRPSLLVVDAALAQGSYSELVAGSRGAIEGLRVVLVKSAARGPPPPPGEKEADVVLIRPFRILQFAEALDGAAAPTPNPADPPKVPDLS